MFEITYKKKAVKALSKMPRDKALKLTACIRQIGEGNETGLNIVKFEGLENGYRLQVGDYRVIYTKDGERLMIEVVKIGSRGDVYK